MINMAIASSVVRIVIDQDSWVGRMYARVARKIMKHKNVGLHLLNTKEKQRSCTKKRNKGNRKNMSIGNNNGSFREQMCI